MKLPILTAALLLAASSTASASPLFELLGDTHGRGGLTARLSAEGAAAAYFNPALLAGQAPSFDLGVVYIVEEIGVTLDGRSMASICADGACDVPVISGRGPESFRHGTTGEPISNPTVPTAWLAEGNDEMAARPRQGAGTGHHQRAYQMVGLVAPIFRDRLTLGLYAMVPIGDFTTAKAFYNDEREQYFSNSLHPELYSDRMTATSLAFGGGFKVHRDLAVGATFTLSLANRAAAPVYVSNLNDLDTVLLDSDIAVEAAVAPHFGVAWKHGERLRAAATLHTKQSFEIDTGFDYILATGQQQTTTVHFTHAYMPLTVAAGASYTLSDSWTATGLLSYARWSQYRDRHGERPVDDYRWSDTITPALGVRWKRGARHAWLDLVYQPSPVPPQTGRSNYVDNDRAGLSAGGDWETSLWGSRVRIGLDFVGHRLFERHVTKFLAPDVDDPDAYPTLVRDEVPDDSIDVLGTAVPNRDGLQTNNPGFPGFASEGWVVGGGFHVAVDY